MVDYILIDDADLWNKEISSKINFNPYQIYEWGLYKKKLGWSVASIKSNNNGKIGYLQITYKIKCGVFIGWCIGSISGNIENFNKADFINFIKTKFIVKYVFIKSSFTNKLDFDESLALYSALWIKSAKKLNSDYTIYVNLKNNVDDLLKNCSSSFRKNIIRGLERNKVIEVKTLNSYSVNEISELFSRFKKIKNVLLPEYNEIRYIKQNLSNNIIIASSKIGNQIVGLRAFLYLDYKALDFWAVSDEVGRKNYTSYVLLFLLLKKAQKIGIFEYDMSGIDPLNNPTGFNFKKGLRCDVVEKLGEWEISNSNLLAFLINKVYL